MREPTYNGTYCFGTVSGFEMLCRPETKLPVGT